jgi:hypothetical protein
MKALSGKKLDRTSIFRGLGISLLLALGAACPALAHDRAFNGEAVECDPVTLNLPGGEHSLEKYTVLTNGDASSGRQQAVAVVTDYDEGMDHSLTVVTGSLALNFRDLSGRFVSSSQSIRLMIDIGKPSSPSHIKTELLNDHGRWETLYDGPAKCGVIQTASVGGHN